MGGHLKDAVAALRPGETGRLERDGWRRCGTQEDALRKYTRFRGLRGCAKLWVFRRDFPRYACRSPHSTRDSEEMAELSRALA
jgi:hypothetical protein